jgi:hypothetical protein
MAEAAHPRFRTEPQQLLAVAMTSVSAPLVSVGVFIAALKVGWQPGSPIRWLVLGAVVWPLTEIVGLVVALRARRLSVANSRLRMCANATAFAAGSLLVLFMIGGSALLLLVWVAGNTE